MVKRGQANAEGLQWAQWPHEVTGEAGVSQLTKLQHHVVRVHICHKLEVFHTGLCHTTAKIQAIGIQGLIPSRGLVLELNDGGTGSASSVVTAQADSKTLMIDMHPATLTFNVVATFLMTTAGRQASAQLSITAQLGMRD